MRFVLFFGIALTILGGVHYYVWLRLVRDTALPQPYRLVATVAIVVLAVSVPATMVLRRVLGERDLSDILLWPAMVWLGILFLFFFATVFVDAVRLVVWAVEIGRAHV